MRKKNSILRRTCGTFAAGVVVFGLAACKDPLELQKWVEHTNKLRDAAQVQGEVVPYRQDQFKALKAYFAEVNQLALALKNDATYAERFNTAIAQADIKATCAKVFLARSDWQLMIERCTRNNFFLCSEEVRAFPEMVGAVREKLVAEQQKRFDQAPECRTALDAN